MPRHRIKSVKLILIMLVISSFLAIDPLSVTTAQGNAVQRLIIRTRSAAGYSALRDVIEQAGGKLILDRPDLNLMVVNVRTSYRVQIDQSPYAAGVAQDQVHEWASTTSTWSTWIRNEFYPTFHTFLPMVLNNS